MAVSFNCSQSQSLFSPLTRTRVSRVPRFRPLMAPKTSTTFRPSLGCTQRGDLPSLRFSKSTKRNNEKSFRQVAFAKINLPSRFIVKTAMGRFSAQLHSKLASEISDSVMLLARNFLRDFRSASFFSPSAQAAPRTRPRSSAANVANVIRRSSEIRPPGS